MKAKFHKTKKGVFVFDEGHTYFLPVSQLAFASTSASESLDDGILLSPMPGKVFRLLVAADQTVKAGQDVAVIEAMKMEHTLKAPFDGCVRAIDVAEGQQVELGQRLVEIDKL